MGNTEVALFNGSSIGAYTLSNSGVHVLDRFNALSCLYDCETMRQLEARGVGEGWTCLEVGGGGGSIAGWLADRVGRTGKVLVTDIDPRFLEGFEAPNIEVRQHNIATDPLPEGAFDLIHARLVLMHVPEREKVLARLVEALKPGGWLVDEEFDSVSVLPDPVGSGEVLLETRNAVMRFLQDRCVERRWGRMLFGRFRALGLVDVNAEARLSVWHLGSPGTSLMRATFEQLREALIEGGYITQQEFDRDIASLDDPAIMAPSPLMWTAWGRRPSLHSNSTRQCDRSHR
jgi:SAM-dependent methyltransferase